jgi:rubrerythrin
MAQMDDDIETGTTDVTYDLISVIYHALQGAENYEVYAEDAEDAGEDEVARFFRDIQAEEMRRAERAKQLLTGRLREGGW